LHYLINVLILKTLNLVFKDKRVRQTAIGVPATGMANKPWTAQTTPGRNSRSTGAGIVLECSDRGAILKVWRDDFGLFQGIAPNQSFLRLMDIASIDKALDFLADLRTRKSAFGCELSLFRAFQPITLLCAGFARNDQFLIFGSRTRGSLLRFANCFMEQEQVEPVDGILQIQNVQDQTPHGESLGVDADIRQSNNELLNLRQLLNWKNIRLDQVVTELRAALKEINTLRGLLPICSCCKKIRDEQGYWNQIEAYFRDHAGVQFTHSICPECAQTLYPEISAKT
jgi:hypothetical protein